MIGRSSVVGYQADSQVMGQHLITPTFVSVSGGTYSLQDLIAVGAADKAAKIQVLGSDGNWVNGTYFWWNADGDYPAGWFDGDGGEKPAVNLEPGQGVFFVATADGISLQSSGKVSTTAQASVPQGGSIVGNPTPSACLLSSITLTGTAVADKGVKLQVLGADGNWMNDTYFWWNADGDYPAGWFDGDGGDKPEITIPAGGAVYITSQTTGVVLQSRQQISSATCAVRSMPTDSFE